MPTVGVIGAGTMGAGIAQVAAANGWSVLLMDANESAAQRAIESIGQRFDRKVAKGKLTSDQLEAVMNRLHVAADSSSLGDCSLIIEAVIEDLDVKVAVFDELKSHVSEDCILASNTSSLSIAEMGKRLGIPERVVGMHFFNPVHRMPLVEVIAGRRSSPEAVATVRALAIRMGKVCSALGASHRHGRVASSCRGCSWSNKFSCRNACSGSVGCRGVYISWTAHRQ